MGRQKDLNWDVKNNHTVTVYLIRIPPSSTILLLVFHGLYRISKDHWNQTVVALCYNVLKMMMEMNQGLFDELTTSYKADRQKEKKKEQERDELWKHMDRICLEKNQQSAISAS